MKYIFTTVVKLLFIKEVKQYNNNMLSLCATLYINNLKIKTIQIKNSHHVYIRCKPRKKANTINYNQWCCRVCSYVARNDMTHLCTTSVKKDKWICNGRFVASSVESQSGVDMVLLKKIKHLICLLACHDTINQNCMQIIKIRWILCINTSHPICKCHWFIITNCDAKCLKALNWRRFEIFSK